MTKRHVIEDSDEEDDEPRPSPPLAASVLTDVSLDDAVYYRTSAAATASSTPPLDRPGTPSAEVLNRNIQDAHKRLMESTPNENTTSTVRISLSQQPHPSPSMSRKRMKRALSNMETTSHRMSKSARTKGLDTGRASFGYCGGSDDESVGRAKARSISVENSPAGVVCSREILAGWGSTGLPGSLEASHTDGSMPPPSMLSRGRSVHDDMPPKDPIQINLRSSAIAALQTLPGSDSKQEHSSSASSVSPSKIITGEKATTELYSPRAESEDELSCMSPFNHGVGTVNPVVLLPQRINDDTKTDGSTRTTPSTKDVPNDLGSDDVSIGMPQEQYRPRPSRSRAGLNAEELVVPVDFSKKPEAVAKLAVNPKRKKRRCKATSFQELRPPKDQEDTAEDDSLGEDTGAGMPIWQDDSSKPHLDAEVEAERDGKTVTAETHTSTQLEKTIQQPKKQRGRPKKIRAVEGHGLTTKATERVDKEVFKTSGPTIGQEAETPSITVRAVELEAELRIDEEGRKSHHDSENEFDPGDEGTTNQKVLEISTGNASKQDSPSTENIAPPETPKRPAKAPDRGPDKHSPINSGKVAYRVGLSKRARIEPLLRIVRK